MQGWREATTTDKGRQSFVLIQRIIEDVLREALSQLESCSADSYGSASEVCLNLQSLLEKYLEDHIDGEDPSFQIQERRIGRGLAIAVAVQQWKEANKQTDGTYMKVLFKLGSQVLQTQWWFQKLAVDHQKLFEDVRDQNRDTDNSASISTGPDYHRGNGGALWWNGLPDRSCEPGAALSFPCQDDIHDLHQMQIDMHHLADLHEMPQYHLVDLDLMPQNELIEEHLFPDDTENSCQQPLNLSDKLVQQHGQMVQQNEKVVQQNEQRMEPLRALQRQVAQQKWTEIKREIDAKFGVSWDRLPSEIRLDIRSLLKRDDPESEPSLLSRLSEFMILKRAPAHQSADHISRSSSGESGRESDGPAARDSYAPLVLRF